ncbi:MAG: ubiquinone/menaquinone biosynthesis methyltransferase [Candidatus Micrarchaeaceae archaeon]
MSEKINRMFSDIHERYDFMNHLMSMGVDIEWRRRAAREAVIGKDGYGILDIASGTGDLAIAMHNECRRAKKSVRITGVDFNKDMLEVAKRKTAKLGMRIRLEVGDAQRLRFKAGSFDVLTSSFAMRDFDSLPEFIREARRVLKGDGKIILMDMSKPEGGAMKYFFKLYYNIMVLEGMLVDREAYSFLVKSIKSFDKKGLLRLLKREGFINIRLVDLPSKTAFMVTANKG